MSEDLLKNYLQMFENIDFFMQTRSEIKPIYTMFKFEDVEKLFFTEEDTVFPVCHDNLDNILGSYNVKNFLAQQKNKELDLSVIKPVEFVSNSFSFPMFKKCDLLVVIDDFGGTSGIITKNTIINFLSKSQSENIYISKDKLVLDAKLPFDRIKRFFPNLEIESKTIGGFVIEYCRTVPKKGDKFFIGDFLLFIEDANKQVVKTISLTKQLVERNKKI